MKIYNKMQSISDNVKCEYSIFSYGRKQTVVMEKKLTGLERINPTSLLGINRRALRLKSGSASESSKTEPLESYSSSKYYIISFWNELVPE